MDSHLNFNTSRLSLLLILCILESNFSRKRDCGEQFIKVRNLQHPGEIDIASGASVVAAGRQDG